MPILSSSILSQLRDTNYTKTRVPYFPANNYEYGIISIDPYAVGFSTMGLFYENGDDLKYVANAEAGVDSFGRFVTLPTSQTQYNYRSIAFPNDNEGVGKLVGKLDPEVLFIFKLNHTTNIKFFFGFNSANTIQINSTNNDPFYLDPNSYHGFGLVVRPDENFKIVSNNGTGTSSFTSDIDTIDTNIHYLYIKSDSINSRWAYSWDRGDLNYITSDIPTDTITMNLFLFIMTAESSVKSLSLYDISGLQKRFF